MRKWVVLVSACLFVGPLTSPSLGQADIEIVKDVRYVSRPSGALAMDAYLPSGPGPHPAVLLIPGGKWMVIDKTKNDWLPRQLAERGFAAFSIEYRPSTTAPFPAAIEDVQAAVRFVRAHAARYHVDPRRLAAAGGSSGGHLAALLATWGEGSTDVGARVRLALSWSGPMDLEPLLHSPNRELVSIVETFLGCSASSPACAQKARLASPITHVDPSDGAFYLTNAVDEIIPASQAREMASALEQADLPHEVTFLTSGHHGLNAAASYKGFDPAFAFLTQWIEPGAATTTEPSPSIEKPGSSQAPAASAAPDGKPDVNTATRPNSQADWLPVVAIAALVIAVFALILMIVVLSRSRKSNTKGSTPDARDPGEDASRRLVGSRSDELG
jgi:acetyl esterase/lipase